MTEASTKSDTSGAPAHPSRPSRPPGDTNLTRRNIRGHKADPLRDPLDPAELVALDIPDVRSIWDSLPTPGGTPTPPSTVGRHDDEPGASAHSATAQLLATQPPGHIGSTLTTEDNPPLKQSRQYVPHASDSDEIFTADGPTASDQRFPTQIVGRKTEIYQQKYSTTSAGSEPGVTFNGEVSTLPIPATHSISDFPWAATETTNESAPGKHERGSVATDAAIVVRDLQKTFGTKTAVAGVSFSAPRGSVLALLGPNGAGKTTTVNMLCTLLKPDGGSALVAGHDVAADPAAVRRSIMLTGQFAALDEALSGRANLVLFGRLMGLTKNAAVARAEELLTSFGLTAAGDQRVREYSGGMRRRVDIACGLVTRPEVVFLDEPTTGLDPRSRQEVWSLVESLRAQGVTILLTTQYLEEADVLSDYIVVIDNGQVIASGTADELKNLTGTSHYLVVPADASDLPRLRAALADLVADTDTSSDADDAPLGVVVPATKSTDMLTAIVTRSTAADITVAEIALHRPSLDDVFLTLTDPSRHQVRP